MVKETIKRIEAAIKSIQAGDNAKKQELLKLLNNLKAEIESLSRTHVEQAHTIAGYTALAAHESSRKQKSEELLEHATEGLSLSVQGFEASHPKLVETVNSICTMLAGVGI
ncbi:MAG: DUF4404 family protein [Elusimicrobia bacterium]|nr:DUF4404 family protein [Elusimicrobiota bacterium]